MNGYTFDPWRDVRHAGMDASFLTGGAGFSTPAPPPTANGSVVAGGVQPHHSVIAIVLFAVAVLFVLDKAGFRFVIKQVRAAAPVTFYGPKNFRIAKIRANQY